MSTLIFDFDMLVGFKTGWSLHIQDQYGKFLQAYYELNVAWAPPGNFQLFSFIHHFVYKSES